MTKIKIIIADDHKLFIHGIRLLFADDPLIEIIAEANDGKDLLEVLRTAAPDTILLDINMPHINGINCTRYIRQTNPDVKIIMLSTYDEEHLVQKAKEVGVNGYLLKNSSKEELVQAVLAVMNGQSIFPFRKPKDKSIFDQEDGFLKQYQLTKRETEILGLLKAGLINQQIAERLFLSVFTVETHRKNIMQKLGLKTPAALVRFLIQQGI